MTRQRFAFTPGTVLVALALVAVMIGQLLFAATKIGAAVGGLHGTGDGQPAQAARSPEPLRSAQARAQTSIQHPSAAGTFYFAHGR
jgi:hypothetical protein